MVSPYIEEIPNTADEDAISTAILGHLAQAWFAMPAIAAQDTQDGHIGQLQLAINGTVIDGDGKKTNPPYPMLNEVPIHHHGGGKNVHTMPFVKGDEILAIFTSRPHDTWHQNGGTSNNPIDSRIHHMSDAFTLRGFRSDPRKIKNVSNVSAQGRSEDGKHTHDIHPVNGITTKSVDKDDKADNPWADAKKYFQSFVLAATGVYHQAVDGNTTHQSTVDHNQITHSLNGGQHSIILDFIKNTIVHSLFNGQHSINLTSGGIDTISQTLISHIAPNVNVSGGNHNIESITNISKLLKTSSIAQLTNYIKF
jgi:hypothetical protein